MILIEKGVDFCLKVFDPSDPEKISWLSTLKATPAIKHGDTIMTNVDDIAEYLEITFPDVPLQPADYDLLDFGCEIFGNFFRYINNKYEDQDSAFQEKVVANLTAINEQLVTSGGPFIAGEKLTLADCNLFPKLHHVLVALGHFKNFHVSDDHLMIVGYIGTMMQTNSFIKTRYPDSWVHARWSKYIKQQ
eukprot:c17888_g1_i1.p1 GENE.c17888_g1_i1~~c17888_g1_i1.p1  ORF type:complete len:190 (+),score=62.02 c17888_g1_i1:67-636(+)